MTNRLIQTVLGYFFFFAYFCFFENFENRFNLSFLGFLDLGLGIPMVLGYGIMRATSSTGSKLQHLVRFINPFSLVEKKRNSFLLNSILFNRKKIQNILN